MYSDLSKVILKILAFFLKSHGYINQAINNQSNLYPCFKKMKVVFTPF